MKIRVIGIILFLVTTLISFGQVKDTLYVFNPLIDDITLRIPPLVD